MFSFGFTLNILIGHHDTKEITVAEFNMTQTNDSKQYVRKFYESKEMAENYFGTRFMTPIGRIQHEQHCHFVNSRLANSKHERVLEIAVGPARVTGQINIPGSFCIGVDASMPMLEKAKVNLRIARNSSWNLLLSDACNLPFQSNYFNCVYTFRFIRHLNPKQRVDFFSEIKRVLKKGGTLMFDASNNGYVDKTGVIYDQQWSKDELISEINKEGFTLIEMVGNVRYYWLQDLLSGFRHVMLDEFAIKLIRRIEYSKTRDSRFEKPLEWLVFCQK